MGEQREWIELPFEDGVDSGAYAAHLTLARTLVRVDDIDATPVPGLHVDLAPAVLVIAGDDQPTVFGHERRREIERRLLARGLDHPVVAAPIGEGESTLRDVRIVAA